MVLVACGDVRQRPAYFLSYSLLFVVDDVVQSFKCTRVNDILSLTIIASHNVANSSEARDCDSNIRMVEKLYKSRQDICR